MRLSIILDEILTIPAQVDRDISNLALDSRKLRPNGLFLAIRGTHLDGRQFISNAIEQHAVAVLVDADQPDQAIIFQDNVPLIPIYNLQAKLGLLAARFFDHPAEKLFTIGATGTNGKTSCTHFIAQALTSLQIPCGIIGTLGSGMYGALGETGLTTPDAVSLQASLFQFLQQGAKAVAMEVSSHSIDQGRVNAIPFDIGLFTNLTQDHLDYHGDMATYASVKHQFIAGTATKHVIINADDDYGKRWLSELAATKSVYSYSAHQAADVYTQQVQLTLQGITAKVFTPWGEGLLTLPLIGQFNLSNALAALTALCVYGIPLKQVLERLAELKAVPGRMQTVSVKGRPLVVVDYAHTPDALEKVLKALRPHTQGKLICVFGCGGDRDPGKRPMMGRIAEQLADKVIISNDNPRHETPAIIAEQILQGCVHPELVNVELDRVKAVKNSIQWAQAADCVLIAGKGAERYQIIGDEKVPYDDVEQVSIALGIDNLVNE